MHSQTVNAAASCESLSSLKLPNATITLAQTAEAFQARSGWTTADRPYYQTTYLYEFLVRVLVSNGIDSLPRTRLLRLIPAHLRIPR